MDSYRYSSSVQSALVALINTELEQLAIAVRNLYEAFPDPTIDLDDVQPFESLTRHVFYDMEDYFKQFAEGSSQFEAFQSQLAKTVVFSDCTDWIYSALWKQCFNV